MSQKLSLLFALTLGLPLTASEVAWTPADFPWTESVDPSAVVVDGPTDLRWVPQPSVFTAGSSRRYIDHEAGDDAHDGLTPVTAWKHHPWDADATGQAAGGDGVHTYIFKRGVTYRGALVARSSGRAEEPIRLTSDPAWGNNEAVLSGAEVLHGWQRVTPADAAAAGFPAASHDRLWAVDVPGDWEPWALWVDGSDSTRQRLPIARDPNWITEDTFVRFTQWHRFTAIEKGMPQTWGFAPQVLNDPDPKAYVGATIWNDNPNAGGEFSITGPIPSPVKRYDPKRGGVTVELIVPNRLPEVNSPFFLENLPRFLDVNGEWFFQRHGADARRLYLRLPGDQDPNTAVITAARHTVLLDIPAQQHIVVSGLTLTGGNIPDPNRSHDVESWRRPIPITQMGAIRLRGSVSDIALTHLRIIDTAGGGIVNEILAEGDAADGITISDSEFRQIDNGGIILTRGPLWRFAPTGTLSSIAILRNRLHDIGLRNSGMHPQAIDLNGPHVAEIAGNIIDTVAGQGINVWSGKLCGGLQGNSGTSDPLVRVRIHHNKVSEALLHTTDFGLIEAWGTGSTCIHHNLVERPSGYVAHRDQFHKNVLIYLDGHHKGFIFTNIGRAPTDERAWKGLPGCQFLKMVRGWQNIAFHNTSVNVRAHYQKEANAGDLFLSVGNLMIDGLSFHSFWNMDGANGIGWAHNLHAGRFENIYARWRGEEWPTIAEMQTNLVQQSGVIVDQVGWLDGGTVVRDAAAGDVMPTATSAAIDRGARVFVPWALYGTVGEWHFLRHPHKPGEILHYDLYPQAFHSTKDTVYNGTPDHRLFGDGIAVDDYVSGPLETFTAGALTFPGTTVLRLTHDRLLTDIPYKTTRGKETAIFPGDQRRSVRWTDGNWLIEAVVRVEPGATRGVIAGKLGEQRGYQLGIAADGGVELLMRHDGGELRTRSPAPIADGRWHHVLAEYDRATSRATLYVDGRAQTSAAVGTPPAADASLDEATDFVVGTGLVGALDYLRVAQGTLADAQTSIAELMAWQFNGPAHRDFNGQLPLRGVRAVGALDNPAATGIQPLTTAAASIVADTGGGAPDPQAQLKTGDERTVKMEHWGAISVTKTTTVGGQAEIQVVLGTETVIGGTQQLCLSLHWSANGKRHGVLSSAKPITVQPFQAGPFTHTFTVAAKPGLDRLIAVVYLSPDGSWAKRIHASEVPITVNP